jgi:hypothetical protein
MMVETLQDWYTLRSIDNTMPIFNTTDNTNDVVYQKRIESATSALNRCKTSSCDWGITYWKSVIKKLEYPESPRVNSYK